MTSTQNWRLITIPASHYCEKARWAIARLGIPLTEEGHMPGFHLGVTKRLGGKSTPILVTEERIIKDSTEILKYVDAIAPEGKRLFPSSPELRMQVEELESLFDEKLGINVRLWAYSYLLKQPKIIKHSWCNGVPAIEKISFPFVFPVVRKILGQSLGITYTSSEEAYRQIQAIFAMVSDLLADGRKYLVGNRFTAADLTFAALAAPILLPPQHPQLRKDILLLPAKMQLEIKQMQNTQAGHWGLSLYKAERFT